MWMFVNVSREMQWKTCSISCLLPCFWFTWELSPCPSPWNRTSLCRGGEEKELRPFLCCNFLPKCCHQRSCRSGKLVGEMWGGPDASWRSLLCVVHQRLHAGAVGSPERGTELPFSRWEGLGASESGRQNPAGWTRDSQPSHREMLGSETVSNPGCPGGRSVLALPPCPASHILLQRPEKGAAAWLPLTHTKA